MASVLIASASAISITVMYICFFTRVMASPANQFMTLCNFWGDRHAPAGLTCRRGPRQSSRNLSFTPNTSKIDQKPIKMSSKQLYEKTREQSISDFEAQTKDLQKEHPDIDFKAAVIEPTMNLMFDIKVCLSMMSRAY